MEFAEVRSRDGESTWRLRYNNRALRWLERNSGLRLAGLNERWIPSFEELTWVVAAGLLHEQPDITLDDADEVIDAVGHAVILPQAMEALQAMTAAPDELASRNGSDSKNASGTGTPPRSRPVESG